jgi:protein transport protein SEC61 subunit gamma-like protein
MEEEFKPTPRQKIKSFFNECKRVFKITKKPSSIEFKTIVKASGLGMIIIGLVGFLISMVRQLLF